MAAESYRLGRVLSLDPTSRGFGYVVFEGPVTLRDWGMKLAKGDKNKQCLRRVVDLIEIYQPEALILENVGVKVCRRCPRVCELLQAFRSIALVRKVEVYCVSRQQVRTAFAEFGAITKHQIATVIAARLPQLDLLLPPLRKLWMSEDVRMSIFDATAFALTLFILRAQ